VGDHGDADGLPELELVGAPMMPSNLFSFFSPPRTFFVFLLYLGTYLVLLALSYLVIRLDLLSGVREDVALATPFVAVTMAYYILFPRLRGLTLAFVTVFAFTITVVKLLKRRARREERSPRAPAP